MKLTAKRNLSFSLKAAAPRSNGSLHRKHNARNPTTGSGLHPDSESGLRRLTEDAKARGLVVFIGSGVNATAAYQWKKLLNELLKAALAHAALQDQGIARQQDKLRKWCMQNLDVCAQATLIKRILGPARYRLEIQHALYSKQQGMIGRLSDYCRQERPSVVDHDFEYLRSVALLCRKPQVKGVLTFNFDTLLETAIASVPKGRQVRHYSGLAPFASDIPLTTSDLPMFYVHGCLPTPGGLLRNPLESVVFAYEEYLDQQADPLSWETATPLHLLRTFCTLWLGTSLADWDMLRLLDAAQQAGKETHAYCIQCMEAFTGKTTALSTSSADLEYASAAIRLQASLLDVVGVRLINAGRTFEDIPQTIHTFVTGKIL